jgi:hypothetical protein
VNEGETIQVVVPPALRPPLEKWLRSNKLYLARIPETALAGTTGEDLPTYIIGFE